MPNPPAAWQRERNKTRQPYLRKLVVPGSVRCHICSHVRSSHSLLTLQSRCHVDGCDCEYFEPLCGCGHILASHQWGSAEAPWACYQCKCRHFGAKTEEDD